MTDQLSPAPGDAADGVHWRPSEGQGSTVDPLLAPYMLEQDTARADDVLGRILLDHAGPVIKGILGYKSRACAYGTSQCCDDVTEIHSEVEIRLIEALRRMRLDPSLAPIENFRAYVAKTTYNAFHDYLRKKHPAWSHLRNNLHYLFEHVPDFAVWEVDRQTQLCGLRTMDPHQNQDHARTRLQTLIDNPAGFATDTRAAGDRSRLQALLIKILQWVERPIELNQLVTIVAGMTGITRPVASPDPDRGPPSNPPDLGRREGRALELREYLAHVWTEISLLPLRQRVALLLNFDEIHGLPLIGIASIRKIAKVLEMPAERLAELWKRLPVDDNEIAGYLGTERQQVINLRMTARKRLARRMKLKEARHAY